MRKHRLAAIASVFLSLVALATSPTAATAQTVFVEGGTLADYDPTLRSDTSTTVGLSGGIGVFFSRRVSARLELDFPQWHASDVSRRSRVLQRIEVSALREEARAPSISGLVAGHIRPTSRVNFAVLGGGTVTTRNWRNTGSFEILDLDGNVIEHRDIASAGGGHRWFALTFGTDATISLNWRLALVPQLRVHSYVFSDHTSLLSIRPRVSLRWHF
jgi:hypothetical protein